MKIDKVK